MRRAARACLEDVLRVLLEQRGEPLAVDALARKVGVSERTVERDLERIRSARLPLRGRKGSPGSRSREASPIGPRRGRHAGSTSAGS